MSELIDPIYIVGPCAAESREQVLATAAQLCDLKPRIADFGFIFRAGVWKPRTSPHTYQGAGEDGLAWLQEVKERFGVPLATEVATPEHVKAALRAGIDYLWIGARTSANPIAVEEIATQIKSEETSLKRSLRGVLIKNPVNRDAALWLGNIERIEDTGVPVMAVHRGCGHEPCWPMAHQVRLARPDIPMLLDPSHMSGDATQIPTLMHKIEELGLNGAMIEVHHQPEEALSDARQQITPEELSAMLTDRFRPTEHRPATPDKMQNTELQWLRAEIDEIDEHLWSTIAARMDVSKRIGEWKKAHGMAPLQPERYQQIVERIRNTDRFTDRIQTDFALQLYDLIHKESLRQQGEGEK